VTLRLHRAPRADQLAEALGTLLATPPDDPFAPELVLVPARGVERWLSQRLSHRLGRGEADDGVCAGVAAEGQLLAYAPEDVYALDSVVDRYLATLPGYDARRGYAFSLGAYLGELVIRVCGGHWTRDEATGQPGVLLSSGRMSLPMEETARRLEVGMSHGLVAFVEACADGRRVDRQPTAV